MASASSSRLASASLVVGERDKPKTPERLDIEKRFDVWRTREVEFAVDATAVSAVVPKVGSDGGAGEWKDTRCLRGGGAGLVEGDAMADAPLLDPGPDDVILEGKWTVGAGVGDTRAGPAGVETPVDDGSQSAKSLAAAIRDAKPCIE